jgi:hypothetical protein
LTELVKRNFFRACFYFLQRLVIILITEESTGVIVNFLNLAIADARTRIDSREQFNDARQSLWGLLLNWKPCQSNFTLMVVYSLRFQMLYLLLSWGRKTTFALTLPVQLKEECFKFLVFSAIFLLWEVRSFFEVILS